MGIVELHGNKLHGTAQKRQCSFQLSEILKEIVKIGTARTGKLHIPIKSLKYKVNQTAQNRTPKGGRKNGAIQPLHPFFSSPLGAEQSNFPSGGQILF